MDEVRVVRRRTYGWPVIIAIILLAIVIAWAFFSMDGVRQEFGWAQPDPPAVVGTASLS
jgi:hypothetical protein